MSNIGRPRKMGRKFDLYLPDDIWKVIERMRSTHGKGLALTDVIRHLLALGIDADNRNRKEVHETETPYDGDS